MNVQECSVVAWRAWDGDEPLSAGCFQLPMSPFCEDPPRPYQRRDQLVDLFVFAVAHQHPPVTRRQEDADWPQISLDVAPKCSLVLSRTGLLALTHQVFNNRMSTVADSYPHSILAIQ